MKANLDSSVYFDESSFKLHIKSLQRETIERAGIALDGTINIDMGFRKRELTQTGIFREPNKARLSEMITAVNIMLDGQTHILTTPDGEVFENLRIDSFDTDEITTGGASAGCKYKIKYTQLG